MPDHVPAHEQQAPTRGSWWCISEADLLGMLREVEAGATPDDVYLAHYLASEHVAPEDL